jgi:predicted nucleotidyltransferase
MTMTLDRALEILRANEKTLRAKGALHAAVFGSVARGEARPDSDVDVLVDLEPHKPCGVYEYVRLQHDIADLFGRKVDMVERKALKPFVREGAMRDLVDAF